MIIPQACKTTFGLKAFPNLTFEINRKLSFGNTLVVNQIKDGQSIHFMLIHEDDISKYVWPTPVYTPYTSL